MLQLVEGSANLSSTVESLNRKGATVHLKQMVGGAFSLYAAAAAVRAGGIHIFVADDRDAAAYLANDFYQLLDESDVYFFPSAYKRSIAYSQQDAQGVVQRTAALTAIRGAARPYIAICTYPEALAETVADRQRLARRTLTLSVGDSMAQTRIVERLEEMSFEKVEFVYQPGQYSVRGGIVDIFSYAESKPYRIDLFGDEIDSIRRFDISSQLSSERPDTVEIIPNMDDADEERISLAAFVSEGTVWFTDADHALGKVNEIRKKLLSQLDEPSTIDRHLSSRNALLRDMEGMCIVSLKDNLKERRADTTIEFRQSPQPAFNKNFEMLADDIIASSQRGYTTWILSQNKIQIERLTNIFHQIGRRNVAFRTLPAVLHEGFVDNDLKICVYTDHQIFDRYQRYRIRGEIKRDEQMTVAELNALKVGDYVVHIDHGVGRFGGLVKLNDNGRIKEAIKLIYKDNDILFVNVHALHRISRYKSGEGEPPKIYKLGGGAWQKLKTATKKAVKDISRELIALYAKRKASKGFAFSADGYLQQELEASFVWEDTPDQQSASQAVKRDMESEQPMDRLVCGDVGSARPKLPYAPRSRRLSTANRRRCSCPRPYSRCNTTAPSRSACATCPSRSSISTAPSRPSRRGRYSKISPRAR